MSLDIFWEDENGNILEGTLLWTSQFDSLVLNCYGAADFPCLRFVDPYGDTLFNSQHFPKLIDELQKILPADCDDKTRQYVDEIIKLINKAQNQVNTYIKFYGD